MEQVRPSQGQISQESTPQGGGAASPLRNSNLVDLFFKHGHLDDISEGTVSEVEKAEHSFLSQFRDELKRSDRPFLESIPPSVYLAQGAATMRENPAIAVEEGAECQIITGPIQERGVTHDEPQTASGGYACAQTISTYPRRNERARNGDPVCDRYGLAGFPNRLIAVLADGCNWGTRPRNAAVRARDAVIQFLCRKQNKIQCVGDAQFYLLRAFNEAHRSICEDSEEGNEPGSTTLLAGIMLEIQASGNSPNGWVFVCASVGDCKAFLLEHDTLQVRDLTPENRTMQLHASDCGGRLGPVMPNGGPDLRNLQTYCIRAQPGDLIMAVSDGVHDNLHPSVLGIPPRTLKLDFADWEEAAQIINVEEVAQNYRVNCLERLIADIKFTPDAIVRRVMEHCDQITKAGREWMESNRGKKLPRDYEKYPGKMDHTTCLVFRVGNTCEPDVVLPESTLDSLEAYNPLVITSSITDAQVLIRCRTISRGKLECLAKKTECILTVTPRVPFNMKAEEETIDGFPNELNNTITRFVQFPPGVTINIHSKTVSYSSQTGIVTIKYGRLS